MNLKPDRFKRKDYNEIKDNLFFSNSYDNILYANGRFFLLGKSTSSDEPPSINAKIVKFLLNDRLDSAFHSAYKSMRMEKWYLRIEEIFYIKVEGILTQRMCQAVTPDVCMTLQAIAYKFNPFFYFKDKNLRALDKAVLRPIRKKNIESFHLRTKEEKMFHELMQQTIKIKNEKRDSSTFDNIIFKMGKGNSVEVKKG